MVTPGGWGAAHGLQCERFCVPIEKQWGDNGTCLMFNGRAFEDGCRCDSTCGSCGYYQEDAMKSSTSFSRGLELVPE
jgi:hypothetical protein